MVKTTGIVFDPSGAPVQGAAVTFSPVPESDCKEPPDKQTTEADGTFFVSIMFSPSVKRPVFGLRIEKDGFEPYETKVSENTYNLMVGLTPKVKKPKDEAKP